LWEWICPHCNFILHARKSRGEIDCDHCKNTIDLGAGKTQETKTIVDPNKSKAVDTEVFAATTPGTEYFANQIRIKKDPQLKGGFKVLRDKGLKITSYHDSSEGKEGAD
jgi:DNA-directed RNA polymerase subunit M/transcription elongation factor TFIIS